MPSTAPVPVSPALLSDVVEESFDEAAFLWGRWESALSAHDRNLDGTSFWVEERLLGALEGVRVAGDAAIDVLLVPALSGRTPSGASAAAYTLGAIGSEWAYHALSSSLRALPIDRVAAIRRGIELVDSPSLMRALSRHMRDPPPHVTAAMIEAAAFRGDDIGPAIAEVLASSDTSLQRAAMAAARFAPPEVRDRCAEYGLRYADVQARNAATELGLIGGHRGAWDACLHFALQPGCDALLNLLALLGRSVEHATLVRALDDRKLQKSALSALAFAGTMIAADACFECIRQGVHSKLATDSFCSITGLDLEKERLVASDESPEREEPVPFDEEDLDADLVPTQESALPTPDVDGVARWWTSHRPHFHPNRRYVAGRHVTLPVLHDRLERGPMRGRDGFAIELAVRSAGHCRISTRAFTGRQRQELVASANWVTARRASPLGPWFSPV
jgi:uncharacterized protein (TIGR02270 family)